MHYGFHLLKIWNTILFWKDSPLGTRFEVAEVKTIGLDGLVD